MNEEQLLEIIGRKEGEALEFKSSEADPRRLAEIVASFANHSGGLLLIGVDDDGRVSGATIGRGTVENLANTINDNTDPTIYPRIATPTVDGKKIIAIEVAPSDQKPHLAFGKPFKRSGNVTKLMSRNEYERLLLAKPEMPLTLVFVLKQHWRTSTRRQFWTLRKNTKASTKPVFTVPTRKF